MLYTASAPRAQSYRGAFRISAKASNSTSCFCTYTTFTTQQYRARTLFNFYDLRFSTTLKYLPFKEKFLLSKVIIKCHYKRNERAYGKIKKNGRIIIGKSYLLALEFNTFVYARVHIIFVGSGSYIYVRIYS